VFSYVPWRLSAEPKARLCPPGLAGTRAAPRSSLVEATPDPLGACRCDRGTRSSRGLAKPLQNCRPVVVRRGVDLLECQAMSGEVVSEDVAAGHPVAAARLFGRHAV
jgi:hypothetical protein